MGKKDDLINKLFAKRMPRNFTIRELMLLMEQCNCKTFQGGRGSSIGFFHEPTKRILQFDLPHPENELYLPLVKKTKAFLIDIGEVEKDN